MNDSVVSHEARIPPADPALIAAAREKPGGWVYEVDRPYREDRPTPTEAIRGGWQVDAAGALTGAFSRNQRYRPVRKAKRAPPAYLTAAAELNPDEWVQEIDPRGADLFPDVPRQFVRGWWYVDAAGKVTGEFRDNSLYEPIQR